MTDIEILKEIAFYSKYINQQKKKLLNSNTNNKYMVSPQYNKYKYVKKERTVIKPVQQNLKTVLINPNFKQTVLINPHFQQSKKIHINPKVLDTSISKENKILPSQIAQKDIELKKNCLRKRRSSLLIKSKYKIVKNTCSNNRTKQLSTKYITKNKYKIDRRNVNNKSIIKRKVIRHGLSDILRNNLFKWKKVSGINQFRSPTNPNNCLTNISGILYRKTHTKLQKIQPNMFGHKKALVVIKGQKYTIANNKKSLKRISHASKTEKIKKKNKIIRNKSINKRKSFIKTTKKLKQKSLFCQSNNLRKNNQPCPVYRRYGNCRRHDSGKCFFLHNPNQIFLCKKFLQGACIDKDCLLSHKVSPEKMPTCKYFLEGCCIRNDCSFLHVKINPKADICRQFLEGFCEKGSECNLRHQFLCPDFEKNEKCPKRKCMYPHKSKNENEKLKVKCRDVIEKNEFEKKEERTDTVRYYVDKPDSVDKIFKNLQNNDTHFYTKDTISTRPQLGILPSFIPLNM